MKITKALYTILLRGGLSKKIDVFKELTPRLRTYELRGQGKKIKTNKHLTLSYKNDLQKRPPVP